MNSIKSNSVKEEVISLLHELPDDITLDEIMHHLYVKQKIIKGLKDIEDGNTYTHEEVKEMAKKW
jgi:predicted Zn-ribbon and HTH transcriptional regulator